MASALRIPDAGLLSASLLLAGLVPVGLFVTLHVNNMCTCIMFMDCLHQQQAPKARPLEIASGVRRVCWSENLLTFSDTITNYVPAGPRPADPIVSFARLSADTLDTISAKTGFGRISGAIRG